MDEESELGEEACYAELRGRVLERALLARERYGPTIDVVALERLLEDRDIVCFPTSMRFDTEPLRDGEFAYVEPLGEKATDGFALVIHPYFKSRPEAIPLLAAYHIVAINNLEVATSEEAELFGATLHGLEVDDYYERVCKLADELG